MDQSASSGQFKPSDAALAAFRFGALFDHLPFAMALFSCAGQLTHVNAAYQELWGLRSEQLLDFNLFESQRPEMRMLVEDFQRGVAGESVSIPATRYSAELVATIRGGQTHWLRSFILPVKNQHGAVCEVITLFEDVTAQSQSYQQLEDRVAERTRELSTLLDISQHVAATLDLKALLDVILDQLKLLIDYSGATVFELQEKAFRILDYRGPIPAEQLVGLRFPFTEYSANQEVIRTRAPVIIADVRAETPLAQAFQASAGVQLTTTFGYIRSWLGVPLLVNDRIIGMLSLDHQQPSFYTRYHADLALTIANQAAIALENARLFEQAQSLAVMMERQRLARELHDSVSQVLYGIALGTRTARTLLDRDPSQAVEPLEYVLSLANAGMVEMRALIFELRPESLELEGLVAALGKQVDWLRARHQIAVRASMGDEPELSQDSKEALYRIAQETLNNIVKHARAGRVELRLTRPTLRSPYVTLDIRDDGDGFDASDSFPGHLGLKSMRERAARLGGTLVIESAPGQGTHVRVRLPKRM